eukprot:2414930-Alexandrium_andersonii.AAC.1
MGPDRLESQWPSLAALATEALSSGWPVRDLSKVLCGVSRRHASPFFGMVRRLGTLLRSCGSKALLLLAIERYAQMEGTF